MIHLKLLSTIGCSRCEQVKKTVERVQPDFPNLRVEVIDLLAHPEQAAQYGVTASPAVIINEKVAFVGGVGEDQLRERLRSG